MAVSGYRLGVVVLMRVALSIGNWHLKRILAQCHIPRLVQ